MPSPDPDRHDGPEISGPGSALDWPRRAGATDEVLAELLRLSRRRRRFREGILVGAGAVLFAILLWPTGRELLVSAAAPTGTIAVDTPAQQRLSDGTVVDLQEGAVMEEAFTPAARRVVLRRGTAHFQVVTDSARPFVVEADGLRVLAVGTAFTVACGPSGVEVLVTEGRVAVAAALQASEVTAGAGESVRLVPGEGATLTVTLVPAAEFTERMAWLLPRLRFADAPLLEAVALINRHNRRQLVIEDDALGELRISGVLRADNQTAFLEALRMNFGIEADPVGDREIRLRRRSAAVID